MPLKCNENKQIWNIIEPGYAVNGKCSGYAFVHDELTWKETHLL